MGHIHKSDDGITAIFATDAEGQGVAIHVSSGDPEDIVAGSLGGWVATGFEDIDGFGDEKVTLVTVSGLTDKGAVQNTELVQESVGELSALFSAAGLYSPPVRKMGLFQSSMGADRPQHPQA